MVSRKKSKRKQKRPSSKRRQKRVLDGGEPITIFIKLLGGKTHISKIDPDNTIESIISECREKSSIDEKEFKYVLRFGSNILSDLSQTISDCGIRNESTLELMKKELSWEFKTVNYQQPGNLYRMLEVEASETTVTGAATRPAASILVAAPESIEKHSKVSNEISDELNNGWEIVNVFYRYHNGPSVFPEILYKKKYISTKKYEVKFIDYNEDRKMKKKYRLDEYDEWVGMIKKSKLKTYTWMKDTVDKETYLNEMKNFIDNMPEKDKNFYMSKKLEVLGLPEGVFGGENEMEDEVNNGWEIVNIYYTYTSPYFNNMTPFPKILYKKKIS